MAKRFFDGPIDLRDTEPGAILMFYASTAHSFYRTPPQLVRRVKVKRTTKTQLIIDPIRNGGDELRFYKETGRIVGGSYGCEFLRPLTVDSINDENESKLRLRVYRALDVIQDTARKLDSSKVAHGPIETIKLIEPMLSAARDQLTMLFADLSDSDPSKQKQQQGKDSEAAGDPPERAPDAGARNHHTDGQQDEGGEVHAPE